MARKSRSYVFETRFLSSALAVSFVTLASFAYTGIDLTGEPIAAHHPAAGWCVGGSYHANAGATTCANGQGLMPRPSVDPAGAQARSQT